MTERADMPPLMPFDLLPPKQPSFLFHFVTEAPVWQQALLLVPMGLVLGHFVWWWAERLGMQLPFGSAPPCRRCQQPLTAGARLWARCPRCGYRYEPGRLLTACGMALVYVVLAMALRGDAQKITEGGSIDYFHYRLLVQLILVTLLVAATVIDLRLSIIPDEITIPGMLTGLLSAVLVGNLQLIPVWLDWNGPLVRHFGPAIPQWIQSYHHLHGLAWSLAGLVLGALLIWLVRFASSRILGMEAMGFGDVTLMAMIGSFMGWQPVVFVFLLAPACGLVMGLTAWLVFRKTEMPYGPYLSAAALIVLCMWRTLWQNNKWLFSDAEALFFLFGVMTAALVLLLGLIRLYRMIPATARRRDDLMP